VYYANPPRVMVYGEWMEGEPEDVALPAFLTARWNGWAVPAFAREQVDAVIRVQDRLRADSATPDDELEGYARIEWSGDTVVVRTEVGSPDEYREEIRPNNIDGEEVWEMGLGWTWETLDFEDPAAPTAPQRAAFDALREGLAEGESVYSALGTVEADGSHTFRVQRAAADQPDPRYTRTETARTVRIDREGRTAVVA
jgi:hypothetical protein